MQKTWTELLGTDTTNCEVDGNRIIRRFGGDQCRILWAFDTIRQAEAAFAAWKAMIIPDTEVVVGSFTDEMAAELCLMEKINYRHYERRGEQFVVLEYIPDTTVKGDPSRRAEDANSVGDPSTYGTYSGL
jgi:hypothetical protein